MEIKNKTQFYDLYTKGFFGNKPLEWNSQEELKKSNWPGAVCIRGLNIPRELVKYNITQPELFNTLEDYKAKKIPINKLRFNQSMPDEYLTIQGEVSESYSGFELTYTTIKKPMNLALKEEELKANGLKALNILKQNLFPSSYSDMQVLFEKYPESVIEFSSYKIAVGNIRGRNTIIWEVRNY
jgi:hypothetical protein